MWQRVRRRYNQTGQPNQITCALNPMDSSHTFLIATTFTSALAMFLTCTPAPPIYGSILTSSIAIIQTKLPDS